MLALGRASANGGRAGHHHDGLRASRSRILEAGTQTTSALIAGNFGHPPSPSCRPCLTAGFVLFIICLIVNSIAVVIIGRSRSGASTEI